MLPNFLVIKEIAESGGFNVSCRKFITIKAIKDAIYIKKLMNELMGEDFCLPIYGITDSKGIRDAVYSTKSVEDKMTRLYVAALKEHLESKTVEKIVLVPSKLMLADCLTKRGACSKLLLNVIQTGNFPDGILSTHIQFELAKHLIVNRK